jgi:hypothetical protein
MTFIFFKTERYIQKMLGDAVRARRAKRLKRLLLTAAICVFLLMAVLALTFSGIGIVSRVEARVNQSPVFDVSGISADVLRDARVLAAERYPDSTKAGIYYSQSLLAYSEAKDKDVLILFNPGGWGTKTLNASPDWASIIDGIQNDITAAGYRVSCLNYLRTANNLQGQLNEFKEMATGYKTKAGDLADMVDFLIRHDPGLKIILAGESTGTIICDEAMTLLEANSRVFSIQTGSPFWYKSHEQTRTVQIKDNGIVPDSFSRGDLLTIITSSFKSLIELKKDPSEGEVLGFLSAPGHEYWWHDPGVCSSIETFLKDHCELNSIPQTIK